MNRWTVLFAAIILSLFVAIGCSGGGGGSPVAPSAGTDITSGPNNSGQIQPSNTSLLGYYDVYLDVGSQSFEVVEDRTASYTVNLIPFLNQMSSPQYGLSFGPVVFDDADPSNLVVDVEFQWHHPFPLVQQYKVYDFMGVIITNGDSILDYHNLRVGNYGSDTYMTNADGYTRWFNPSEFTTELIFGWAPGGIQNLEGSAKLNPFRAYGKGLDADGSLWDWLESGSNSNGLFQSGGGRKLSLEFPSPQDGLVFGYAAVCCWEEQGTGPYTPYHREEPIAFNVTLEDNIYYDGSDYGGDVRALIDIWAWGEQPSDVLIESSVLSAVVPAWPTGGGGPNWSTYEIDVASDVPLTSNDDQEMWVIAERLGHNYINVSGVAAPSSSQTLAAFFRVPMFVATEKYNACPEVISGIDGNADPMVLDFETYTCSAIDADGELIIYRWTVYDVQTGLPVPGFDAIPDLYGSLDVDWGAIGVVRGEFYEVLCAIDDYKCITDAPTVFVEIANSPPTIVSGVTGTNPPVGFTMTYNVLAIDDDGDPLTYNWNVTETATGDPVPGYIDVPGDGAGNLDIDFGALGAVLGDQFDIDCDVDDGIVTSSATQLTVKVIPYADIFVSNHVDFASEPEMGTITQPYHTIDAALTSGYTAGDIVLVDKGSGAYNEQVYLYFGIAVTLYGYGWYEEGRPVLEYGPSYPVYIYYTNNCTVRGFKIQYASGATAGYLMYIYQAHNAVVTDCWLTGETSNTYPRAVYSSYTDNFHFTNNEVSDLGYNGTNYCNVYGLYIYRGMGTHEVKRNIITNLQPDSTMSAQYFYYAYCYYWPAGSEFSNNLVHHAVPEPGASQYVYIYGIRMYYPYATVTVSHNTVDYFSYENVTYMFGQSCYGMYIYDYGTYHANTHSNIVTRFYKNPLFTNWNMYGIYCVDGSNYCDVWDFPYGAMRYGYAPEGPNSINADPLFVEDDVPPYDYTLGSGSPCIGTGLGSNDMGAYGNLASGEVVGLISPK